LLISVKSGAADGAENRAQIDAPPVIAAAHFSREPWASGCRCLLQGRERIGLD
jgi:hypothetical protein